MPRQISEPPTAIRNAAPDLTGILLLLPCCADRYVAISSMRAYIYISVVVTGSSAVYRL